MVRKNKEQRKKRGGACLLRYCVCYPVSLSLNTVFDDEDDNDDDQNDVDYKKMIILVNNKDSDIFR